MQQLPRATFLVPSSRVPLTGTVGRRCVELGSIYYAALLCRDDVASFGYDYLTGNDELRHTPNRSVRTVCRQV